MKKHKYILVSVFFVFLFCLIPSSVRAAIAIDASTPVRFSGTPNGAPLTSASFTAPANSVLVLCVSADDLNTPLTFAVADSGNLQWTTRAARGFGEAGAEDGHVSAYTAVTTSATSRTVSVTRSPNTSGGTNEVSAKVYVVTGASTASPITTVGEGSSQTNSITPTLFNGAADGAYAFVCGTDWTSAGAPTSSDLTVDAGDQTGISSISGYKQLTANSAQTANLDAAGAGAAAWNWVALHLTPRSQISKPSNNLGLVGYWSFNEATSTQATDFSGNGNHGTLNAFAFPPTSASGWTNNSKRGGALVFDGTNDDVTLGDINATDGVQRMTLSAWVKADTLVDFSNILTKFNGTSGWVWQSGGSGVGSSAGMAFYPVTNGSTAAVYTTGAAHEAGVWEHWVVVWDGTQGTNLDRVNFYKNGVVQAESQTAAVGAATDSNSVQVAIGGDTTIGGPDGEFDGVLDEVRMYNRALTPTEINSLYAAGAGGSAVRISNSSKALQQGTTLGRNLVGHWTFDGGDVRWTSPSTGVAYDVSGNSYTGTLTNMSRDVSAVIGKLGQALTFDGVNDTVSVTDNAAFDLSNGGQYSWAGWIKPSNLNLGIWNSIWTQTTTGVNDLAIYAHSASDAELPGGSNTNGISAFWFQTSGNKIVTEAENTLQVGEWAHVTVTYDGTLAAASRFKIYVNGQNVTGSSATAGTVPSISPDSIKIGSYGAASDLFNGAIEDVRFYSRLLSATEVLQLYRLGKLQIRP